jgi:uncharacterized protein DUF3761
MNQQVWVMTLGAGLFLAAAAAHAAAPANAPAGTTGLCNDGSYYSGATKKGACKGHKGVKEWYADAPAAPAAATQAPAKAPAPATPAAPTAAPAKPAAAAASTPAPQPAEKPAAPSAPKAAAAGGGPGKVWVNKSTKVYHCPGDRYYGKTKEGEYMSEADATAQGFKADHGKACK